MESTNSNSFVIIDVTEDTPRMILDAKNQLIDINGPSYPEDAYQTYVPVLQWIDSLDVRELKRIDCILNFTILSSASHKMVFEVLIKLEKLKIDAGVDIRVSWKYDELDEDMLEVGEDFQETLALPITLSIN